MATQEWRLLSVDQGTRNLAMVGLHYSETHRLLTVCLTHPLDVMQGQTQVDGTMLAADPCFMGRCMAQQLDQCWRLAVNEGDYQAPALGMLRCLEWWRKPVHQVLLEAAAPPRPDNYALAASIAAWFAVRMPEAQQVAQVQRRTVMAHWKMRACKGDHAASKRESLRVVDELVQQGHLRLTHNEDVAAMLLKNDHVCDALLQGLYHWRSLWPALPVQVQVVAPDFIEPTPLEPLRSTMASA